MTANFPVLPGVDHQARDVPLDAHLHTDQSPDSSVPIDIYAAQAVERGIPEIAITDHVDFDPRDPASSTPATRTASGPSGTPPSAGPGVVIRFGAELTFNRFGGDQLTWRGIATTT